MLTKKLKKIGKECRKADDPVLLTLAAYVDHVANYLERAKDGDVKAKEYGNALARLDLSAVTKAHEALAMAEPTFEPEADIVLVEHFGEEEKKAAKKTKKKEAKKQKKAEEAQATAAPTTPQEADKPAEPPVESPSGKKGKKNKKKGK
jgi:hypothetical protein